MSGPTAESLDRKIEHDKLAMLRISLDTFETRYGMPSWMAYRFMRGEPVPPERVKALVRIDPEKTAADYLRGRESIRARLGREPRDVGEWLDQWETWEELSRERFVRSPTLMESA